jgi:hypothetical protein
MLHARNTIIAGNTALFSPDLSGNLGSLGHNLIGNTQLGSGFDPTDLLNVDPLLGPLQDNGGPTKTMALLPGSPAIDAGDNTDASDWDQRGPGFPRIVNGIIDIGAYEVQDGECSGSPAHSRTHVHPLPSEGEAFLFSGTSPAPLWTQSVGNEMVVPAPNLPVDLASVDQFFSAVRDGEQLLSVAWSKDRRIYTPEDDWAAFLPNERIVEGWIFPAPNSAA